MSDISKCTGQGCPLSLEQTCRRFTDEPSRRQSWISPEVTVGGECPNYLPNAAGRAKFMIEYAATRLKPREEADNDD